MDKMTWEGPDTGEVGEWDFGFTPEQLSPQEEAAAKDDWYVFSVDWRKGYDGRLHTQITWKLGKHEISMFNSLNDGWKLIGIDNQTGLDMPNMPKRFAQTFGYDWDVKFPLHVLEQIDSDLHEWGRIVTNVKYVGKTIEQSENLD